MKLAAKLIAVLLVIAVVAIIWLANNLGDIIKQAVETYAPPITETSVRLDSASIMPLSGAGSLGGFNIGQPKGFGDGNIMALGEVAIALDLASLNSDTVVVRKILIDTPELLYVQNDRGNNLQALLDSIERNTASSSEPASGTSTDQGQSDSSSEKKIIIDELSLKAVTVSALLPQIPGDPITITLPDITIRDIGRKSGGERVADAMRSVAERLNRAVADALANSKELQEQLKQKAREEAERRAKEAAEKKLEEELGSEGAGQLKSLLKNR